MMIHHHHHHRIHGSSASNHESRLCQAGHPFQYRRVSHLIITLTHSLTQIQRKEILIIHTSHSLTQLTMSRCIHEFTICVMIQFWKTTTMTPLNCPYLIETCSMCLSQWTNCCWWARTKLSIYKMQLSTPKPMI